MTDQEKIQNLRDKIRDHLKAFDSTGDLTELINANRCRREYVELDLELNQPKRRNDE